MNIQQRPSRSVKDKLHLIKVALEKAAPRVALATAQLSDGEDQLSKVI